MKHALTTGSTARGEISRISWSMGGLKMTMLLRTMRYRCYGGCSISTQRWVPLRSIADCRGSSIATSNPQTSYSVPTLSSNSATLVRQKSSQRRTRLWQRQEFTRRDLAGMGRKSRSWRARRCIWLQRSSGRMRNLGGWVRRIYGLWDVSCWRSRRVTNRGLTSIMNGEQSRVRV